MNVECSSTHRASSVAASIALAAICLIPSACARRPASDIKPGQPGEVRLVYQHSKAPAAGLRVTQILSTSAEQKIETSDSDGRVQLHPDAGVTIADPDAGNCELMSFRTDASIP